MGDTRRPHVAGITTVLSDVAVALAQLVHRVGDDRSRRLS